MRSKKQIRKIKKTRPVIGYIIMGISLLMLIACYFSFVLKLPFIQTLKSSSLGITILVIITILWVLATICLFFGGLIILMNNKVRHQEYTDRPHSSNL